MSCDPEISPGFRPQFAFCALCSVSVRPLFGVILPYACSCLHQCLDPEIAHGISCCDAEPIPEQIDHLNLLTIQTICVLFPLWSGTDWENYLDFIRREWRFGRITEFPFCLLTLYAGVAFHNYESGDFWKPFAAAIGVESISPSKYTYLNDYFVYRAKEIGLETLTNSRGNDFVGTAIFQIGVPLSFWSDFLKICENLWWREDWKSFSSDEWGAFVTRKVGGLARLKRFLVDTRKRHVVSSQRFTMFAALSLWVKM